MKPCWTPRRASNAGAPLPNFPGHTISPAVPFRGACWSRWPIRRRITVKAACAAGFTHATHFYNAMTGVHREGEYKREGTVEGIYLTDEMTVEVIADGIHVPPALLRMAYKFKGAERVALVTDSMAAGAMPEGGKPFDPRVIVEDGVCKLADRSALAGSIATADRLIRTMVREAGVPLEDAVRMASETPARIMGISDRKGTLEAGKDADVILFDDDITVRAVFVGGRRVK